MYLNINLPCGEFLKLCRIYSAICWWCRMGSEALGFGQQMKLFSQNGFNLAIRYNGLVEGTQEDDDPECCLEIISAGPGVVQIKGMESDLCLCFDSEGQLYGEQELTNDATVFRETLEGLYNAYKSEKYPEWFVGIKKNGKTKPGPCTKYGQKAERGLLIGFANIALKLRSLSYDELQKVRPQVEIINADVLLNQIHTLRVPLLIH